MEDLAIIVTGMLAVLFLVGIGSVVLSFLSRRKKVSKTLAVIVAVIITIFGIILTGGSERVAAIPILWGVISGAIALWPASLKTKTKPKPKQT
jgi:O-antigen/teichoic acid export membrane protein